MLEGIICCGSNSSIKHGTDSYHISAGFHLEIGGI